MPKLSANELRYLVFYDPLTGEFFHRPRNPSDFKDEKSWKIWTTRFANKPALAFKHPKGYMQGTIWGKTYFAHQVAWALYHGEWPSQDIDHINGNSCDNRIENLRCVPHSVNQRNTARHKSNKTGVSGVHWHKRDKRWIAYIGKQHIGSFASKNDAIAARKSAEPVHDYHPNHGRAAA